MSRANAAHEATARDDLGVAVPRPAWWLPGPHLPTLFSKMARRVPLPATVRVRVPTGDGDSLAVERLEGEPGAPRVVLFHGLEGGMHSTYARGVLTAARERGWHADLVLWRTCDGNPVNAVPRAYHSGATDDARIALEWIVERDAGRPTFVVGVSLGGNVLLKLLGELGNRVMPNVRGAVAISVPFDLAEASRQTERGFSTLYGWFFLRSLKRKAFAKLARFPGAFDADALARARSLWEFDDVVTAPLHGFADAADYYEKSSSIRFLDSIQLPTLLLNAQNDPFVPAGVLEQVRAISSGNPYLEGVFPPYGGHAGFIGGSKPWEPLYWMESAVFDWISRRRDF